MQSLLPFVVQDLEETAEQQTVQTLRSCVLKAFNDKRPILIVGPCSLHNLESDLSLAYEIASLQKLYPDILFVFRAHFEKPRSTHFWRGLLLDPFLDNSCDLVAGVEKARAFLKQLVHLALPVSTEFIDPLLAPYIEEYISIGVIGARTVYSQTHRQLAANLPMPILFKNSIDGGLEGALDAMQVVRQGLYIPKLTKDGIRVVWAQNTHTHLVLRGGFTGNNLHLMKEATQKIPKGGTVWIDCGHQNSEKDPLKQATLFANWLKNPVGGGCMVECNHLPGSQPFSAHPTPGISITDPCIGLKTLKALLSQYISHQCGSVS